MLVEPLCAVKDCTFFCSKVSNSQIFNCCLLDSETQTQFGIILSDLLQILISLSLIHWQLLKTLYTRQIPHCCEEKMKLYEEQAFQQRDQRCSTHISSVTKLIEEQQRVFLPAQAWSSLCSISPHSYIFHMIGGTSHRGRGYSSTPPRLCSAVVRCREISTVPPHM